MRFILLFIFLVFTNLTFSQVGIGRATANEALDISNDSLETALRIEGVSTGDPQFTFVNSDLTYTLGLDNTDSFKLKLSTSAIGTGDYFIIDTNGLMGIPTIVQNYRLNVDGSTNLSVSTDRFRIGNEHVLSKPNTRNLYVGQLAGNQNNAAGFDNVYIGFGSGQSSTSGKYNVFVGSGSGNNVTTGLRNTLIGFQPGNGISSVNGNVIIGRQAGFGVNTADNLVIANSSTSIPMFSGNFGTSSFKVNGSLLSNGQAGDFDFTVQSGNLTHALFVDASTDQVFIGRNNNHNVGGVSQRLHYAGTSDVTSTLSITQNSTDTDGATINFAKSRGDETTPSVIQVNDLSGVIKWYGYSGVNYNSQAAIIDSKIDPASSVGSGDIPMELRFQTVDDGSTTANINLIVKANGNVGIGKYLPLSTFELGGSFGMQVTEVSADATLDETHNVVVSNTSGGDVTLTLPAASTCSGRIYYFVKTNAANSLIIDGNGTETINGSTTKSYTNIYSRLTIVSNGADWIIMHEEDTP
jgi:hypothetical protein